MNEERPATAGLTAVAEDYVKAIWSAAEWGGPAATVTGLAQRFGTAPATVSVTLKRLAAQGLVIHDPYRPIELTDAGRAEAIRMVRRHRLIETFLVERLGYRWDEVHGEAERLEHAVSDAFLDRIDDALGRPGTDPHGDPIPSRDGRIGYPPDAHPLATAGPGRYLVVRVSDRDPVRLVECAELGIRPGCTLVLGDGRIEIDGRTVRVPPESAGEILVAPAPVA